MVTSICRVEIMLYTVVVVGAAIGFDDGGESNKEETGCGNCLHGFEFASIAVYFGDVSVHQGM